jgi:hypothetical protein
MKPTFHNVPFSESRASGLTLSLVLTDWVRCETAAPPMSEMGHERRFGDVCDESAYLPIAALEWKWPQVAFGPGADLISPQLVPAIGQLVHVCVA